MKRTIIAASVLALGLAGTGVSLADHEEPGGPGPNGHNNYGLCKAYFAGDGNGNGKGAEKKKDKGPFPALVAEAGDYNGDGETNEADVVAYCDDQTPGGKG